MYANCGWMCRNICENGHPTKSPTDIEEEEAAPSGVALAGVGLGAGAVLAARVADALVAVDASPSRTTPIEKKNRGLCEKMDPQATTFD